MKEYMNVLREAVLNIPSNYTSKKDKIESYIPFHISGQNCLKVGGHSRMSKKEQITVALYIETYVLLLVWNPHKNTLTMTVKNIVAEPINIQRGRWDVWRHA